MIMSNIYLNDFYVRVVNLSTSEGMPISSCSEYFINAIKDIPSLSMLRVHFIEVEYLNPILEPQTVSIKTVVLNESPIIICNQQMRNAQGELVATCHAKAFAVS